MPTDGANEAICVERASAHEFRERPVSDAAVELHLPEPVLSLNKTLSHEQVVDGGGVDVWDTIFIPVNLHRSV